MFWILVIDGRKLLSPSGWNIVCVGRFGADLPGQPKVCYFDQFWTHAQQILWLHVSMKETCRKIHMGFSNFTEVSIMHYSHSQLFCCAFFYLVQMQKKIQIEICKEQQDIWKPAYFTLVKCMLLSTPLVFLFFLILYKLLYGLIFLSSQPSFLS